MAEGALEEITDLHEININQLRAIAGICKEKVMEVIDKFDHVAREIAELTKATLLKKGMIEEGCKVALNSCKENKNTCNFIENTLEEHDFEAEKIKKQLEEYTNILRNLEEKALERNTWGILFGGINHLTNGQDVRLKIEQAREQVHRLEKEDKQQKEMRLKLIKELHQALSNLTRFKEEKATQDEVLEQIVQGLKYFGTLKKQWMELLQFFDAMSNLVSMFKIHFPCL
jgi:hypothetical protein